MTPLESDEVALDGDIMQTVAQQVNDAFLGIGSYQGGKTRTYLEEYCTAENLRDSVEITSSCMDLIYVYTKTYRLMFPNDSTTYKLR